MAAMNAGLPPVDSDAPVEGKVDSDAPVESKSDRQAAVDSDALAVEIAPVVVLNSGSSPSSNASLDCNELTVVGACVGSDASRVGHGACVSVSSVVVC